MGYVLLWAIGLCAALLCLALSAAWATRKPSAVRAAWVAAVFFIPVAAAAFATHATAPWQSHYGEYLSTGPFTWWLSWLIGYLALAPLLLWRALRREAPGLGRAGAGWPRGKLWAGLGGAALAMGLTLWNLDLAARTDLAIARQEAGDLLLTLSPPAGADSEKATRLFRDAEKDLMPVPAPWGPAAGKVDLSAAEVNWDDPSIATFIARQEKVLGLLRKAAAAPPESSTGRPLLHDPDVWRAGREKEERRRQELALLAADARVKAARGDLPRAFEDVTAILGFTRHVPEMLPGPPTMYRHFVAWRALEDVLRLAPAKAALPAGVFPEVISPFRIVHREIAVFGMIWPALFSERLLRLHDPGGALGAWGRPPLVYATDALVVPACRVAFSPAELAYSRKKWEAARRAWRSAPEGTPKDWASLRDMVDREPTGLYSALMVKPREKVLVRDGGRLAALEQLARAALAAARYREKHGRLPQRLEQLVPAFLPAMPTDPRDGQALRMKHFGEVTVLHTAADSPGLEAETAWAAEKHRDLPIFRLYPRGKEK